MSTAGVRATTARGELLELTGAQLGIWNAQWLEPDSPHYLVGDVVEIDGEEPLDVPALAESVRRAIEEAETLHLRFHDTPDGPRQSLVDEPSPPPGIVDLRTEADPVAAAHAAVASIRARAAEACRGLVDRRLDSQTLLRLSDRAVWWVQLYHHVIIDGYSAAMMARRAAAHYTALVRGTERPAPEFGAIADLVAADQEYRAGERYEKDRTYWRDRLTPLPDPTSAEWTARTASGAPERTVAAAVDVSPETLARLRAVGDETSSTWADVLIGCFAAFLHRAHGETDVVIGMPLMCRVGKAALRTPAMAVNLLPLRVTVRGDDRLADLGHRVAGLMKEMRAHQRFRGADLPRELGVPGLGAMLIGGINLKAFDYTIDFAGSTGVMRNVAGGPPQDFELTATPTADGGIRLGFEVDDRLTDQAGVAWRADALLRVIDELASPEAPPIGRVDLVTADERDRLRKDWTGPTRTGVPDDVPTALDRLRAEVGDRTALVCGPERLTAGDLVARVHRTARALRARGVGTDDVVALALPRTADLVVTLLAVMDAGAAYLPLDLAHPTPRLRELIGDARPALVVASGAAVEELGAVDVADLRAEAATQGDGPLDQHGRAPDELAYVIYTSGSTGRPKGVLGRAGGLAGLLAHHRETVAEVADRVPGGVLRVAHTYSFAFDASIDQLLWLLCGHELHLYDTELTKDAEELLAAYGRDRIDVVDTTPSMAAQLVEAGLLTGGHPPSLLILGGEATPPALWQRVADSGVPARNMYGPTEAAVDATVAPVVAGTPTIGGPLPGTRIYLLDVALQPVPHGSVGELYLAGPHLARGYLNHPETTAERFVADPFGPAGERMYRTGDLARWVPGRGLDYLGRGDGQVKIRGYRVEIGEVEGRLADLPGVRAAAAAIRTDTGRPQLVGYVVPADGATASPDDVRRALAARVPEHMVPSTVLVLDALPTTTSGKLDRLALPAPPTTRTGRGPGTEHERALCEVLADVLGLDRVGVDDDFVGIGGDSITAISVCSRLRAHGLELRPRELLAAPDVASLAALARRSEEGEDEAPEVLVDPASVDPLDDGLRIREALPATDLQAGLVVHSLSRGEQEAEVYLVQGVHHLVGTLDPERLRDAAEELLRRSPALRSVLTTAATGEVVQVVPEEVVLGWRHVDLASRPRAEQEQEVSALARAELDRPWHPARPPLIRFVLASLRAGEHRLILTNHHALLDGWSMPLVCRQLFAIYDEIGGGAPAPRSAPVTDFLRWLARQDRTASLTAWRELLEGIDEGTRLAPARGAALERPERLHTELDAGLSEGIRAFARARGLTLATVVQTAWGLLLARLTGRHDVVFASPVSGRSGQVDGIETMIGQLGNTVVVRLRYTDRDTVEDVLARMHEQSTTMTDHHHVGLADVQRTVGVGDLFDTLMVTENLPMSARTGVTLAPGIELAGVDTDDGTHYPMNVVVLPEPRIVIRFGYQPSAFDAATVRDHSDRLRTLLREMITHPGRAVSRLRLLEPDAEARVLAAGTEHVVGHRVRGGCLEEFAAQVQRRPDKTAVECRDRALTYAELDRRANRLAHALIEHGVRPEQPVAVLLERDVEMVVAVLGIFKAGAVYMPMDPGYPRDRLEYMVGDAAAVAAVTTGSVLDDLDGLPFPDAVRVLRLDAPELVDDGPSERDADPVDARRGLTPDALAYVIYTSGTTGRPKGVAVSHTGFAGLIALQEDVVGVTDRERYLHFASTSFDVAVWQMMLPLLSGGTSVIAPEEVRLPGHELLDYAAAHRVTGINLLPSFLAAMPDDAHVDPDVFFVVGAERLDPALARRWGDGRRALFNAYGPTEVTINSVTWRYDPAEPALDTDEGTLPIGRPDPDVRAYVLDSGLLPVGVGMVGELYLAGPGLARGYLGLRGQTAQAFVADPYGADSSGRPGERMYRTGDRVRWRDDGQLVYLGRTDDQVKVRGVRIEPAEIEAALARHPDVRAGVVEVREDRPGERRLVGYVVPMDGARIEPAVLRAELAAVLPTAMVPTALIPLEALPLGPSGKLDRGALPAPDHVATPSRAPSTPAETVLLAVLREVLDDEAIELDDEFIDVGGDSIVSLAFVSRARRQGVTLAVRDVLEGGTVAGIAALAAVGPVDDSAPSAIDLPRAHVLTLRRSGAAEPLFCVHPAGGFATVFTGLVRELPPDRPVIGLQLPSLEGSPVAATTIDELAASYLATIRAIRPTGPYHLLGYSFGGNVVHALAALLAAEGEEVAFSGMIDSGPLAAERADGRGPSADVVERELRAALPPGAAEDAPELLATVRSAVEQTVAIRTSSHAPVYDGGLTLFAASGSDGDGERLADAWRDLVGADRLVVHHVEGDHGAMVSPRGWSMIGPIVAEALADPVSR